MGELKIVQWKGEAPVQPAKQVGKVRQANPFDESLKLCIEKGVSFSVIVEPDADQTQQEAFGAVCRMLRNAAKFVSDGKKGVDIRILEPNTIWYTARDVTPRGPRKLPNGTAVADEGQSE